MRDYRQHNTDDDTVKELASYRSVREREEQCELDMELVSVSLEHSDCVAEGGVKRRSAKCLNSGAVMLWGGLCQMSEQQGSNAVGRTVPNV